MATRRYSLNVGDKLGQTVEAVGAATATGNIELTVDLAATGMSSQAGREKVLLALENLASWILKGNWPPA